ncbi:hypothetical protein I4U23_028690 [Adineta vaga]|nr:hypothetical protein I4U23_028690 [Adineta vaga]
MTEFLLSVNHVLAHEKDINILENKLRRHFNAASSSYLCSTDFQSSFDYLHDFSIQDTDLVETTLSTSRKTVIISSKCSTNTAVHLTSSTTEEQTVEQLLNSCNDICTIFDEARQPLRNVETQITPNPCELKREKKINKLQRRLTSLSKLIRELEEKDMSLDEMEHCDLYEVESSLKKQACEMYAKLTKLNNESASANRILDQPITLSENDIFYPSIHQAVEEMINQTKYLPSFYDVLQTVEKTNDKCKLNLEADNRKTLAEKIFKLIGTKVKNRRMADFNDIMSSRLPEDFDIEQYDPASNSIELENTLNENKREAVIKTEKILQEFSQIDPELESEENIETSEKSNSEDDREEIEAEIELVVEPFHEKCDEYEYDIVDILPPPLSRSASPVQQLINETETNEDSLNSSRVTILSTASLPPKRDRSLSQTSVTEPDVYTILDSHDTQESQSITIIEERQVQTLIPRRRSKQQQQQITSTKRTLYDYYKRETTKNSSSIVQKRSPSKKFKEHSEIVILD